MSKAHTDCMRAVDRIEAEIIANISEYAAMVGIAYRHALCMAETRYTMMVCAIHASKGRAYLA